MARQILNNGEFGSVVRSKLNSNFEELYTIPGYEPVNVKDPRFGAVGDGVADDTAAIQAALDFVTAGALVYFPAGTYRVTGTLTVSRTGTRLVGYGNCIFSCAEGWGNLPVLDIAAARVTVDGLQILETNASPINAAKNQSSNIGIRISANYAHVTNCKVSGFLFPISAVGASADWLTLKDCEFCDAYAWCQFNSVRHVTVRDCEAHNNGLDGWKLLNTFSQRTCDHIVMDGVKGYNNGQRTIEAGGAEVTNGNGIDVYNGGYSLTLTNCKFFANYGAGFNIKGPPIDDQPNGDIILIGVDCYDNLGSGGHGFEFNTGAVASSSLCKMIGCRAINNASRGITLIHGHGYSITDCLIRNNQSVGIQIQDLVRDVVISNSHILANGGSSQIVVGLTDSGTRLSARVRVRDCVISGLYNAAIGHNIDPKDATGSPVASNGIRVYSAMADVSISGCAFYGLNTTSGAIQTRGNDVLIANNYIYNMDQAAITVYGGRAIIENNHIEETDFSSTTNGASIWIFDGAVCDVGTNRFTQASLVANSFAIKARSGSAGTANQRQFATNINVLSNLSTALFKSLPAASAVHADSVAADVATLVSDYNGLLAKLRTAGVILT